MKYVNHCNGRCGTIFGNNFKFMNQNVISLTLFFLKTKIMQNSIFISWFLVTYLVMLWHLRLSFLRQYFNDYKLLVFITKSCGKHLVVDGGWTPPHFEMISWGLIWKKNWCWNTILCMHIPSLHVIICLKILFTKTAHYTETIQSVFTGKNFLIGCFDVKIF